MLLQRPTLRQERQSVRPHARAGCAPRFRTIRAFSPCGSAEGPRAMRSGSRRRPIAQSRPRPRAVNLRPASSRRVICAGLPWSGSPGGRQHAEYRMRRSQTLIAVQSPRRGWRDGRPDKGHARPRRHPRIPLALPGRTPVALETAGNLVCRQAGFPEPELRYHAFALRSRTAAAPPWPRMRSRLKASRTFSHRGSNLAQRSPRIPAPPRGPQGWSRPLLRRCLRKWRRRSGHVNCRPPAFSR